MNPDEIIPYLKEQIMSRYGMQKFAEMIKCSRPSLYKTLRKNGNPRFFTIIKIAKALGLEVRFKKKDSKDD